MAKPKCPNCGTNDYVVLNKKCKRAVGKTAGQVGDVVGATIGGSTGLAVGRGIARAIFPGAVGAVIGGVIGAVAGGVGGAAAGKQVLSTTGQVVGTGVDLVRSEYKCNKCGKELDG